MRQLLPFLPVLLVSGLAACGSDSDDTADPCDSTGSGDALPGDASASSAACPDGGQAGIDGGGLGADANVGPDAMANPSLSFFATSTGSGIDGGDLGGLAGADAKCQALGASGGAGSRTWRAYLSTGASGPGVAVDARDRIGSGPWSNAEGTVVAASVTELHTSGVYGDVILDELGNAIPGNEHDILTGSAADGTLSSSTETCQNWTYGGLDSSFQAQVGHADTDAQDGESWNSQHSGACDETSLNGNAGTGRLYCFAAD